MPFVSSQTARPVNLPAAVAPGPVNLARRLVASLLLVTAASLHSQVPSDVQTFVYKHVGQLEIKADVFRSTFTRDRHPVILWLHGGALMNGSRQLDPQGNQDPWLWQLHRQRGYVIVSVDYRLAPETKLPAIIGDVEDAVRWIRRHGPELFQADPERIAVVGRSAGGYLALMTGFRVQPRPVALVSLWGYGDLIGPWYSEPSPHPRHHQFKPTADEAWSQVADTPVANARDRVGDIRPLYQYCRQHGLWPKAVSGWDPAAQAENYLPFMPLRNITPGYPPTYLVHGLDDTDVPCAQSELMAGELQRHGVRHQLVVVPGAEHGLTGLEPDRMRDALQGIPQFLMQHLEPDGSRTR